MLDVKRAAVFPAIEKEKEKKKKCRVVKVVSRLSKANFEEIGRNALHLSGRIVGAA